MRLPLVDLLHARSQKLTIRWCRMRAVKAAPYRAAVALDSARLGNLKRGELFVVEEVVELDAGLTR